MWMNHEKMTISSEVNKGGGVNLMEACGWPNWSLNYFYDEIFLIWIIEGGIQYWNDLECETPCENWNKEKFNSNFENETGNKVKYETVSKN